MKMTKTVRATGTIAAIVFVAYNVVLFSLCGFGGHTGVFWTSWALMLASFGAIGLFLTITGIKERGFYLRDWLLGFPLIRHSTIFISLELCLSILFVALERRIPWGVAFAALFLVLCVYCVFAISCLMAKNTIQQVQAEVKQSTDYMKLLRVSAESLVEKCGDAETRADFRKLSEAIRYSDPISSEQLADSEQRLSMLLFDCDQAVSKGEFAEARVLCGKAMLVLSERNRKCKALK